MNRPRVGPLAAALVASFLLGCGEGDGPAGNEGGNGSGISGVVSRQKTGVGVGGVTIAIVSGSGAVHAAVTAPDGSFSTGPLADGVYELVPVGLELAGLDPRFDVLEPVRDTVTVSSGSSGDVVFAVVGIIPARVTGEITCGGEPDPTATVRVAGGSATNRVASADALGRYAVLDLLPGVYTVIPESGACAVAPGHQILTLRPGEFGLAHFGG